MFHGHWEGFAKFLRLLIVDRIHFHHWWKCYKKLGKGEGWIRQWDDNWISEMCGSILSVIVLKLSSMPFKSGLIWLLTSIFRSPLPTMIHWLLFDKFPHNFHLHHLALLIDWIRNLEVWEHTFQCTLHQSNGVIDALVKHCASQMNHIMIIWS